jgi:hypothetical protein
VGQLRVIDWPMPNGLNRCTRKAKIRFIVAGSLSHDLLCPIFDPVMIRVDESGMYLSGWEISTADGEASDHAQVWWLTPLAKQTATDWATKSPALGWAGLGGRARRLSVNVT